MGLELTSGRSADTGHGTYFGSVFSIEFIKRIGEAANYIFLHVRSLNKYIFLIIVLLGLVAVIHYFRNKKQQNEMMVILAIKCIVAVMILYPLLSVLSAKVGMKYVQDIRGAYGLFFYALIFVGLYSLYILKETRSARLYFPFVLVVVILVILNSRNPYTVITPPEKGEVAFIFHYVPLLVEADERGYTDIFLYVPEVAEAEQDLNWIADTLHKHKVTTRRITITRELSGDGSIYYVPRE
ncbi:MAG: hypothetical protein LBC96_09855 [Lachnospiraceae bacterium]|nr:hypothetical protein [Lachnospiraceae bacterium]